MKLRRFEWEGATGTAGAIRAWTAESAPAVDVSPIEHEVSEGGDEAVLRLNARFAAPGGEPSSPPGEAEVPDAAEPAIQSALRADAGEAEAALAAIGPALREAMELAGSNIRAVAEAQLGGESRPVGLPQGQTVTLREAPVVAAGVYAPGGRAAYPSSVLMCCLPARIAGVERIALASPPGPDGRPHPLVLAAAALCEVDEVYAMGGAQAIFALAYGTESVRPVDVIVGPGNAWVQEAKRAVYGRVGIDSYAGPSELMVVVGHDTDPEWAALDLCAQAEHGAEGPLVAVAVGEAILDAVAAATELATGERAGVGDAPLALVQVPDLSDAIDLANAFAPEHLELMEEDAALLADKVTTAGCVFAGRHGATAFGDYAAGSNHVLPTGGAGRFSGPLGPGVFRRKISTVRIPADAAAKLAPHVDALARAEGFPVHGESAMIRARS